MSETPEVGVSKYCPSRREILNPIANGQPDTSNAVDSETPLGFSGGAQCTGETDTAGSVASSYSTHVTQGKISLQGDMESMKSVPLAGNSASAQVKISSQNFTSQRVHGGQSSPSNMLNNSQSSMSSKTMPGTDNIHLNAGSLSQNEPQSSTAGMPSRNGPPVPAVELPYKFNVPTHPSSVIPNKIQLPAATFSSSNVGLMPAIHGAHTPSAASATSLQGTHYSSPAPVMSSHSTTGQNPQPGLLKPQSMASQIPPSSTIGPVPPQMPSVPFPAQPSAGPYPNQSSASPFSPQSLSGPFQMQSPAVGPYPPQSIAGQFPPQPSSGQYSQQPPGGPFPGQPQVRPHPPQSSAGMFQTQAPAGQFPPQASGGQFQQKSPVGPPSYSQPSSGPVPPHLTSGSFPTHSPQALAPSSSSLPPSIPNPPVQSPGSYPPFSSSVSSPPSSTQIPPQSYSSFTPGAPLPNRPSMLPTSGQQFAPPMSQSTFPPPSTFPSPPGQFAAPPTPYAAPTQSSHYVSDPHLPLQSNHVPPGAPPPPGNSMSSQQPPPPRPPTSFPPLSQSGGWAQANGIPNQSPQMESITHQPAPGGMPMYQQGGQQMPQAVQPSPGMVSGAQQMTMNDTSQLSRKYPQQQAGYQQYPSGTTMGNSGSVDKVSSQLKNLSVTRDGFNRLWGANCYDLLQTRNVLPAEKLTPPKILLHEPYLDGVNCKPEIFRCTLTKIPETNSLLQKSRLPLGILIHPFRDINNLPVVQCNTIVRCRACRTYINPFVYFVDHRRWKCNLCFRVNDLPEEFQFDPVTKTYGDPSRRPEINSSTIEYIAPSEYMLRPPQAAVYLFLLDVSCGAVEVGYLNTVCDVLYEELSQLPGDSRTQIGFIAFDSALHFFALAEGLSQPQHLVVSDTTEVFLPRPDNLLVNLQECKELVQDLLAQLPMLFVNSHDNGSALGPALQAAYKLMAPTGGRVTVFQTCLPSVGAGALKLRGNDGSTKEAPTQHINPATDFYKRLALDCSGQQVAVDLFILGIKYTDLATLSGVSQFSGGCIHYLPRFDSRSNFETCVLERSFHRYLSRKIGFEAVMRIRCSRGLSIHTFHGHFFVRSTDLLSLPNVNPDAGYGMQVAIDESLTDLQNVCFQAALLYTSSKGERRIRVHTLCLPLAANVNDVMCAADQQCIVGLLAKMAVDRSHQSSPADARDAFINVATDVFSTFRLLQTVTDSSGLLSPFSLRLLPLYILALLKHVAFRAGQGTRLDERVYAMCQMKCLPLSMLMQEIYPDLYPIHSLSEQPSFKTKEGQIVPCPPRLHLSAEKLDSRGVFLLDRGETIIIYVGRLVSPQFCQDAFGVPHFAAIQDDVYELHTLENPVSESLHNFIRQLQSEKPYESTLQIIREDSRHRMLFIEKLIEDRSESALSYYEFLQHLKAQVK